jgi:hypothetical protein
VDKTDGLEINALGYPAEHAGPVAVDAVPQDLTHEAADLPQTQLLKLLFRKYFCPLSFAQAGPKVISGHISTNKN